MSIKSEILDAFISTEGIVQREFVLGKNHGMLVFKPDLVDSEALRFILQELSNNQAQEFNFDILSKSILNESEIQLSDSQPKGITSICSGDVLIFLQNEKEQFLIVSVRKWVTRAVAEPPTETVMRGPREGFVEDVKANLTLLERRIHSPAFAIERLTIGRYTNTSVALCYIKGIAGDEVIQKVKQKLQAIDIDAIYDSQYLIPYLEERPDSMFHQIGISEKPDIVSAKIMEGRVAIVVDGSPLVLTVPFLLIEDFQSSTDYYERSSYSGFFRILRFCAMLVAILLPGLYVSIQIYHYNIIPLKYLVTLMNAAKGIPIPPLGEMLVALILFEIVREASLQMPRAVGMATAIVGTLILGETAVSAGILSSPVVMFAALSSLAVYIVPNLVGTLNLMRLILTLVGGLCGLYGIAVALIFVIHYLCQLDCYKTPYLAPFAPLVVGDLKDSFVREPIPELKKRPKSIPNENLTRQR